MTGRHVCLALNAKKKKEKKKKVREGWGGKVFETPQNLETSTH